MIIVLDTSAAIDVVLNTDGAEKYRTKIKEADAVIAPEIYIAEISNVAWKYRKLADFTHEECLSLADNGINLVDAYIPVIEIWKESLREAMINDHPVYDCLFVVCARRNDGILLTKDAKLKQLCDELEVQSI